VCRSGVAKAVGGEPGESGLLDETRRFDENGCLIVEWDEVAAAARRGGAPTPDDVTIMSDGHRIDSADKLREVIAEFERSQTARQAAAVER